jgi:hypothetical protein
VLFRVQWIIGGVLSVPNLVSVEIVEIVPVVSVAIVSLSLFGLGSYSLFDGVHYQALGL